jgi:hypothetical protein
LLQNGVPLEGAPHLLQNLEAGGLALSDPETTGGGAGTGGAGGAAGCGGWLAASRVSAPHFTQNIPLTGAPHLLQTFAIYTSLTVPFSQDQLRDLAQLRV